MHIEVRFPTEALTYTGVRTYDPEADDIRSLLADVCDCIAESGQFIVSGFGQDPWPTDVGTDLPVLLEQLPEALDAIESSRDFKIDFYEQGLERTIEFSFAGACYVATCASFGSWQPTRNPEPIAAPELEKQSLDIREGFMRLLKRDFHELAESPFIQSWLR